MFMDWKILKMAVLEFSGNPVVRTPHFSLPRARLQPLNAEKKKKKTAILPKLIYWFQFMADIWPREGPIKFLLEEEGKTQSTERPKLQQSHTARKRQGWDLLGKL